MWGVGARVVRDNVNYYKSVHQLTPAREKWEHSGNFQSESVSSAFNEYFIKLNHYFSSIKRKFLESTSQFPSNFASTSVSSNITPLCFTYFPQKQLIKV